MRPTVLHDEEEAQLPGLRTRKKGCVIKTTMFRSFRFQVVCAKCSNQKFPLPFEDDRLCRVCRSCYQQLIFNQKQQLVLQQKTAAAATAAAFNQAVSVSGEDDPNNDLSASAAAAGRPRGLLEVIMLRQ